MASVTLHLGDLICLHDIERCICASGIGTGEDVDIALGEDVLRLRESGKRALLAVFAIQAQSTWMQLKQFKGLLDYHGLGMAEGAVDPRTRLAFHECVSEREHNDNECAHATGRDLRFGMIIQLRQRVWQAPRDEPPAADAHGW